MVPLYDAIAIQTMTYLQHLSGESLTPSPGETLTPSPTCAIESTNGPTNRPISCGEIRYATNIQLRHATSMGVVQAKAAVYRVQRPSARPTTAPTTTRITTPCVKDGTVCV